MQQVFKLDTQQHRLKHVAVNLLLFIACLVLFRFYKDWGLDTYGNFSVIPLTTYCLACLPLTIALQRSGWSYGWIVLHILTITQTYMYIEFEGATLQHPGASALFLLYLTFFVYQSVYSYGWSPVQALVKTVALLFSAQIIHTVLSNFGFFLLIVLFGSESIIIALTISYTMSFFCVGFICQRISPNHILTPALLIGLELTLLALLIWFNILNLSAAALYALTAFIGYSLGAYTGHTRFQNFSFLNISRHVFSFSFGFTIFVMLWTFTYSLFFIIDFLWNDRQYSLKFFEPVALSTYSWVDTLIPLGIIATGHFVGTLVALDWALNQTKSKRNMLIFSCLAYCLVSVSPSLFWFNALGSLATGISAILLASLLIARPLFKEMTWLNR